MPHVSQGELRQSLVSGRVLSPTTKRAVRRRVLEFITAHTPKDGKVFTLPGTWDFERSLLSQRPETRIVAVEHSRTILEANHLRMPGGVPQKVTEEIGGRVYQGYRTNSARILRSDFTRFVAYPFEIEETSEQRAFVDRWLDWDAVWLDACSNLAPKPIEAMSYIKNGCRRVVVPVVVTTMLGRESEDDVREIISDFGGGVIGRVRTVAAAVGCKSRRVEHFTYRTSSDRSPGKGSTMIVVMMLLNNR